MKYLLLYVLVVLSLTQTAPPVWPPQFTLSFDETAKLVTTGTTKGTIYYDALNNREVVERASGKYDRYCGTVYKFVDTPCRHVIVDNKRFLDFPDKRFCCFCCDSTHGCGIILQDWLAKGGAVYNGTEQLDSKGPYQKWYIKGLQDNYYYNKADGLSTPRKLSQLPEDIMDFTSYSIGKIDESKFQVPDYCTSKCGLTTVCAGLRGEVVQ